MTNEKSKNKLIELWIDKKEEFKITFFLFFSFIGLMFIK